MAAKKQILIVDDDHHVREILRLFLERHGYRVSEAPNGYEAVEACRSSKFDLIIADIYMPGMDGIKSIEALHKFSPETKVVAISGGESCHFFTSSTQLNTALYKGALVTLTKPIKEGELVDVVKKIIAE
ncbi:MAG TPA: response regulator [Candidatus Brocadiaceae bacterium]|nr:response regulator [Candidatus Brocadiaceae bacterium]